MNNLSLQFASCVYLNQSLYIVSLFFRCVINQLRNYLLLRIYFPAIYLLNNYYLFNNS